MTTYPENFLKTLNHLKEKKNCKKIRCSDCPFYIKTDACDKIAREIWYEFPLWGPTYFLNPLLETETTRHALRTKLIKDALNDLYRRKIISKEDWFLNVL